MKRVLRLGILGTGVAARRLYLPAWAKLRHKVRLVACANRSRAKAEEYAALAGIPTVVDDAEALFALKDLDAVLISLPIEQQPHYVLKALKRGLAVVSEKPVAPSTRDGLRLLKAASKYSAPWLVAENFAFMKTVQRLQSWVTQGRLGEIRLCQVMQLTLMDRANPYFHTAWRADPHHVGSFVVDGGVHLAHVLRRCFGMPTMIYGHTAALSPTLPPPDTAVAILRFASGALGTWNSCFSARYEGPTLRVFGSKGSAELFWDRAVLRDAKGKETIVKNDVDSFQAQFSHFADVVLNKVPVAVPPSDALLDLQLIEAVVSGKPFPSKR